MIQTRKEKQSQHIVRSKLISISQRLRIPTICVLCNQFHSDTLAVCNYCISLLPELGPCCQKCSYPLPKSDYLVCGECIKNPPYFDRSFIAYPFVDPLRGLLHQFKFENGLYLTSFLIYLMRQSTPELSNTLIIPVPAHPDRLKQRGYNQAAVLAKYLAKTLNQPYTLNACRKIRNTPAQATLDATKRRSNLKNAFEVTQLPANEIVLVDDLMTTGATANELARLFKLQGATRVDLWCCARTIKQM